MATLQSERRQVNLTYLCTTTSTSLKDQNSTLLLLGNLYCLTHCAAWATQIHLGVCWIWQNDHSSDLKKKIIKKKNEQFEEDLFRNHMLSYAYLKKTQMKTPKPFCGTTIDTLKDFSHLWPHLVRSEAALDTKQICCKIQATLHHKVAIIC